MRNTARYYQRSMMLKEYEDKALKAMLPRTGH